jgi:hypothetical protein
MRWAVTGLHEGNLARRRRAISLRLRGQANLMLSASSWQCKRPAGGGVARRKGVEQQTGIQLSI